MRNLQMYIGGAIVLAFVLIGVFASQLAPHDPLEQIAMRRLLAPGESFEGFNMAGEMVETSHVLGTDQFGRDILSRVIYGARVSLVVGVAAVLIGSFVGSVIGLFGGYFGGMLDVISMRIMDVMLGFPALLLALVVVTVLGASTLNVILTIAILNIPTFARIVRGSTLTVKKLEYIDAIKAVGAGNFRIITVHVLPNILSPIIVQATLSMGTAIVLAAVLSFLGVGTPPPTAEWGGMIDAGRQFLLVSHYLILFPGIALFLFVVGVNIFGDGLRDFLEPKKHR